MKFNYLYCSCGNVLTQHDDILSCPICHAVYKKNADEHDTYKFLGYTSGTEQTRSLMSLLEEHYVKEQ